MPKQSKDFTPIQGDYEFFASHSTEADAGLDAYAEGLRSFAPPNEMIRMLDFGCGPGSFTKRFLERAGWGPDRLDLSLVEPSETYRRDAVERLKVLANRPIRAWSELLSGVGYAFDLVLSNHVLYYVPELEATLGRIVGLLGSGGMFLTTIAGRDNVLIDFWYRIFPLIGQPVPYHIAEDVEAALTRLGRPFERRVVRYSSIFPDTEENRLKILRFLFGEHLASMTRDKVLGLFESYVVGDRIEIHTCDLQYHVQGGA